MKKTIIAIFLMLLTFTGVTFSQVITSEVYTNYGYGFDSAVASSDLNKGQSSFNIKDVFIGATYGFSDNFASSATMRYDGNKLDLYTAGITYSTKLSTDLNLELSLGKLESYWYNYTNMIWDNYAIDNVISNKFNIINRTGTGVIGKLVNKNVTGVVEINNGTNNRNKSYAFNIILSPIDNFKIGGIYNYKNCDSLANINTFGVNALYQLNTKKMGTFKLYGEYLNSTPVDTLVVKAENKPIKLQAFSLFGEYYFNESPFSIVVKYDKLFSGENSIPTAQYILGGINYSPNFVYKFGLNWRNTYYYNQVSENKSHNEIYFTAGFTF